MDENLSAVIARAARDRGLDVTSAQELRRRSLTDDEQLIWAAEHGRCLVTRDIDDFPGLSIRFEASRLPHAGVIIIPPSIADADIGGIVRALLDVAETYSDRLESYAVLYLSTLRRR